MPMAPRAASGWPRAHEVSIEKRSMANFSKNATVVLRERYLRRDKSGRTIESPAAMLERVATAVAAPAREFKEDAGYWEERFWKRLDALEFLPNSPALMNAGLRNGQLAACFVLPIHDDLDSIFGALALAARIQQTGGGTGFSFSELRPAGDRVSSTGGVSSGPISFMELFDRSTTVVRAGGRRRGANMAVLRADHPDIADFVRAKLTPNVLENFNLSVGVTDEFLEAVDSGAKFALRNPRAGHVARRVDARRLFDAIVEAAHSTGDPGLLFLDEINRHNSTPALGRIDATNPCGEQPLLPYESCTLGSINLAAFVGKSGIDWTRFKEAVRDSVVFLDNLIEASHYPAQEIESATRRTRKIGLGIMGFADLLAELRIPYDSERAVKLGERIAETLTREARLRSIELAQQRGSFPAFAESRWSARGMRTLRNATVTCIAPTGTVSLLAGCSSGIEPYFALATVRRALDGRRLVEISRPAVRALEPLGSAGSRAIEEICAAGSMREVSEIPKSLKRCFPIALELSPLDHVRMQAAFQKHIDAAVSKTVNLPAGASAEDVRKIFAAARKWKLKGVTVYRYGSKEQQPISLVEDERVPDCRECAV
jgi:ribonucleoside-diphosphate reductase alpha chain